MLFETNVHATISCAIIALCGVLVFATCFVRTHASAKNVIVKVVIYALIFARPVREQCVSNTTICRMDIMFVHPLKQIVKQFD